MLFAASVRFGGGSLSSAKTDSRARRVRCTSAVDTGRRLPGDTTGKLSTTNWGILRFGRAFAVRNSKGVIDKEEHRRISESKFGTSVPRLYAHSAFPFSFTKRASALILPF